MLEFTNYFKQSFSLSKKKKKKITLISDFTIEEIRVSFLQALTSSNSLLPPFKDDKFISNFFQQLGRSKFVTENLSRQKWEKNDAGRVAWSRAKIRAKERSGGGRGGRELGGRNNPVTESRISDFWGLHRANFCTGSLRCYRKFRDPARNGMLNHVDQRPDVGRGFLEVPSHFGINIFTFVNLLSESYQLEPSPRNRTCG